MKKFVVLLLFLLIPIELGSLVMMILSWLDVVSGNPVGYTIVFGIVALGIYILGGLMSWYGEKNQHENIQFSGTAILLIPFTIGVSYPLAIYFLVLELMGVREVPIEETMLIKTTDKMKTKK